MQEYLNVLMIIRDRVYHKYLGGGGALPHIGHLVQEMGEG